MLWAIHVHFSNIFVIDRPCERKGAQSVEILVFRAYLLPVSSKKIKNKKLGGKARTSPKREYQQNLRDTAEVSKMRVSNCGAFRRKTTHPGLAVQFNTVSRRAKRFLGRLKRSRCRIHLGEISVQIPRLA